MVVNERNGPSEEFVRTVSAGLQAEGQRGAVIIGSVARRTAEATSDLDLLVVTREGSPRAEFERSLHGTVLVETVAKTESQWLEHLRGLRPRWVYSFLDDGEILFDDGVIASLRSVAEAISRDFNTPLEVRRELATLLWHGRAKAARAAASDDPVVAAYWAALLLPDLIDALLALGNRPTSPGSRRLDVLASVRLDDGDAALLATAMTAQPFDRIRATQQLSASLLERLGDPDLERVDW